MKYIVSFLFFTILFFEKGSAQGQPRYTEKLLISTFDPQKFKPVVPTDNGFVRTYINTNADVFDLDDDSTTFMKFNRKVLICIEGSYKKKRREGIFSFYVMDSLDDKKRYKIWEQDFVNDKINGQWHTYTLSGGLVSSKTMKNDMVDGLGRSYWIDGKTLMEENEYFPAENKEIVREFFNNGKIAAEKRYVNSKLEGLGKKFYEDGTLMNEANFKDGEFDGIFKWYHPNGKLWIEQIFKNGKAWKVVGNYTIDGKPRNAGTLNNGNGTIILYNDDNSVRKTELYTNGVSEDNDR